ncbi:hypothetical protein S7335_152 [Synechococcus sp. PCC 7335]|nr:hypothetical protein S7335_152 [Synechococcus sp. PCC 7335]
MAQPAVGDRSNANLTILFGYPVLTFSVKELHCRNSDAFYPANLMLNRYAQT